ncbi:AGE family epimerase/isomerase [Kribbella sp. DT2]|uniref:AGE family epimerase/isomerase n=1 Tax=Kribbella sp. DT2 TaxID=3393427 RepID=UPI003CF51B0F
MPDLWRDHLVDDVLGWWMTHGPDPDHGGVLTCWDNAGTTLVSTDKYTWSQGRWIWLMARVAAKADLLGVDPGRYLDHARSTAVFVRDHALLPDGSTAYVTDRTGTPKEPVAGQGISVSVFADLFVALGFAGLAKHDPEWAEPAESILLSAAARIADGTFRSEPYPVPNGRGSFALPMILTGVGEQVHRATGSARSLEIVREAVAAIESTFVHGDEVVEMPPYDDSLLGRHRAPGHTLEALWFLHHARDLAPGTLAADTDRLCDLAEHACRLDWDDEHGGLLRFVDSDSDSDSDRDSDRDSGSEGGGSGGRQPAGRRTDDPYEALVAGTWDTKLWWPHAEALYTTALLGRAGGRAELDRWHERLRDYTLKTFPAGPGEEWIQIRRRDGSPLDEVVALPVKDPFHIARSLLLLVELEKENA